MTRDSSARPKGYFGPEGGSQQEKRQWRLQHLRIEYDEEFSLSAEVADILNPVAAAMREGVPRPLVLVPEVEKVAGATYDLVAAVVCALGQRRGHEPELTAAVRAFTTVTCAQVSAAAAAAIVSGGWDSNLVALAAPFSEALSDLLAGAPRFPRRGESLSAYVIRNLRPLDRAVRELEARVDAAAKRQALGSPPGATRLVLG